jgi:hypothetical protein
MRGISRIEGKDLDIAFTHLDEATLGEIDAEKEYLVASASSK